MFTNVFRIGGLQQVSWFQLLAEGEVLPSNFAKKERSQQEQDVAAMQVMRAHMWLQDSGNLSSWTVSDDKVKLWLFIPGRHDTLNPLVQRSISGLKVVGSGLWRVPGECTEIGYALDQALRNRIEKGFKSVSYVRFGDVFVKCLRQSANELNLRKSLFSCELVFTTSNDAIFVHVLVRRKRVRQLVISDLQAALAQQRSNSGLYDNSLAVIVAPNGLSGRLSGCAPDDLVIQLYKSKSQAYEASSLPFHVVGSTAASGTASVQPCFAEVMLEPITGRKKITKPYTSEVTGKKSNGVGTGHVLIYPLDAVLVPMRPVVPSHPFIRRCWFQEWAGTTWLEDGMNDEFRPLNSKYELDNGESREKSTITGFGANGSVPGHSSGPGTSSNSSGGSSSSSQGSSGTSSSSDADGDGLGEIEADGDSLGSKAAGALTSKHNDMRAPVQGLDIDTGDMKSSHGAYSQANKRGRPKPVVAAFDPPSKALKRSNSIGNDVLGLLDTPTNEKKGTGFLGESSGFGGSMSGMMGAGTPRGGGSQGLGNPWDQWDNDGGFGMGLGMDIQSDADILAEFGDFGDFFEDDGLGFGEPPDTAESQALMFSLPDYGEVTQTPGTAPIMDTSDPMVLPILDFPLLEMNQNMDILSEMKPVSSMEVSQGHFGGLASPTRTAPALNLRLKSEALLCFATGFEPVDMTGVPDSGMAIVRDPYIPMSKKNAAKSVKKESYVYTAIPVTYAKFDRIDTGKDEQGTSKSPNESGESKRKKELTADYIVVSSSRQTNLSGKLLTTDDTGPDRVAKMPVDASGGGGNGSKIPGNALAAQSPSTVKPKESVKSSVRSSVSVLATELECALLQVMICRDQDSSSSVSGTSGVTSPANEAARYSPLPSKDSGSDITQVQSDSLVQSASGLARPQQERRKKVPERIAGHAEEEIHDGGGRVAEVGVWRPVGVPNAPRQPTNTTSNKYTNAVDYPLSNITSPVDPAVDDTVGDPQRQSNIQEILEAIPLLAQQASIAVDVSLDGQYEDGPFGWLAAQEVQKQQRKRRADCSQAGGGGMLASSRFLDQSGMEILDPLSAEISAATAASLLQSDVRVAISNAFGDAAADGPLGLVDWCKGAVQGSDGGLCAESTNTDSREVNSTVTVVGESMTPGQSGGGSSRSAIDSSSLSDQTEASQRRGLSGEDSGLSQVDALGYNESSILALPTPSLLVGYQDDWLRTSSGALHLWEKAPLEPYALAKQVNYHVVCLASEPLVSAAADFFQQLSSVYEVCRLGSHMPSGAAAGQSVPTASSSKQTLPGFTLVDIAGVSQSSARGEFFNASNYSLAKAFAADMAANWNMAEFRKALGKVCKALPISSGSSASLREPEQGPCTVVYIVCPVSDPAGILQTMVDACSSLGSAISNADSQRHGAVSTPGEDSLPSNIVGFSTPRFALQLITAETIFKNSGPQVSSVDVLKEVALGVYNKVRRIPRKTQNTECLPSGGAPVPRGQPGNAGPSQVQANSSMPGLWKNVSNQQSSGNATMSAMNSSNNHTLWEGGWKPSMQTDLGSGASCADPSQEKTRYLYEPAYILARSGAQAPARALGSDATRDTMAGNPHRTPGVGTSGPDVDSTATTERLDVDPSGASQQAADLHCCYTWSGDWNWLVSVWTDARGELLDTQVLPLTGVDVQRENCFHGIFDQVLQQGLQLLNLAVEAGSCKPRGLSITRLGGFYVRESQEWHRVIMSAGADDIRKWPVQIRHPDYHSSTSVGGTGSSSDMGLMTDRGLGLAGSGPTSPSPSSSSFGGRGKSSHYNKPGADLSTGMNRRQNQATNQMVPSENAMAALKWVHSISLVSVRADQSLQIVSTTDGPPEGNSSSGPSWPTPSTSTSSGVVSMGVNTVKTLASTGASYLVVPSHPNRPLTPSSLELLFDPSLSQSPLAQCLHLSGLACPVTTAFAVSAGTTSTSQDFAQRGMKEDWPSTMSVGLVAHYSSASRLGSSVQESQHTTLGMSSKGFSKSSVMESKEQTLEVSRVLQVVASDLHALSWLNVGLTYVQRRSPLPFHCEVAQRFQRLLDFLDGEYGHGLAVVAT
ncbi:hypothetical protein KC19_3G089700 [Ceratodon purpureus]|uniref:Mediator of RNA polymerase II transcription subunit 13 n=1 Tax=Ceratodon purpureus TaxID=3225 RepID=A0A8T0IHP9_CERPU|nr:hypothetical protein KC19_3G089700 [Ceratodon purpureus]